MNQSRKDRLSDIIEKLSVSFNQLEEIRSEEEYSLKNIEQPNERKNITSNVHNMDDCLSYILTAIDNIENMIR